ncbi:UNKNOWN [Stylonychia lemnae]|uniref:Uncharacterized protein n=1 Tax=Stylonychia lemnae TaxID=5949 RepID=A0A077ZQL9_STYLE|nr:UNKNOWN [Stylonychia lemnae]|eukprot:CDW72218.1 UNKNOWN [Stylonychia lemnae]
MNILMYSNDQITLPDEYDSETNEGYDSEKKSEDQFISLGVDKNKIKGEIISIYVMHSDDFNLKTIIHISQKQVNFILIFTYISEKMTVFQIVLNDNFQQKYEQFNGLTGLSAIEIWKINGGPQVQKKIMSSSNIKGSQTIISIDGRVKDHLKANDLIMCKVESFDIWLKIEIQLSCSFKALNASVEIKVDKDIKGKDLINIIQKFCVEAWNSYCDSASQREYQLIQAQSKVKASSADMLRMKEELFILTDFKTFRVQIVSTSNTITKDESVRMSSIKVRDRKLSKKMLYEIVMDQRIGEMFTYTQNLIKVECKFQTLKQLFQLQNPMLKFVSETSLDTNRPSVERKSTIPLKKNVLNTNTTENRRFSTKLGLMNSPEKRKNAQMSDPSNFNRLENVQGVFSTSMPYQNNFIRQTEDSGSGNQPNPDEESKEPESDPNSDINDNAETMMIKLSIQENTARTTNFERLSIQNTLNDKFMSQNNRQSRRSTQLVEEDSSLIQDTSKRLSTSVDMVMTYDQIQRSMEKSELNLQEIKEQEEQDIQPGEEQPSSARLIKTRTHSAEGQSRMMNNTGFLTNRSLNTTMNPFRSLGKIKNSEMMNKKRDQDEEFDLEATPRTQAKFRKKLGKKQTGEFTSIKDNKQDDSSLLKTDINDPLLESFQDQFFHGKLKGNLHLTVKLVEQPATDLITSKTLEKSKNYASVTNRESQSDKTVKNTQGAENIKENRSIKNENQVGNHTKKASIFGNLINYIRGTPRVQHGLKKLQLKVNPQEEEMTDEQMIQKINFDQIRFILTYEEFIAIKIPITKNFYFSEKDIYDTNESDLGGELFESEERKKKITISRNFLIAIGLFIAAVLIITAIVFIVIET